MSWATHFFLTRQIHSCHCVAISLHVQFTAESHLYTLSGVVDFHCWKWRKSLSQVEVREAGWKKVSTPKCWMEHLFKICTDMQLGHTDCVGASKCTCDFGSCRCSSAKCKRAEWGGMYSRSEGVVVNILSANHSQVWKQQLNKRKDTCLEDAEWHNVNTEPKVLFFRG